MQKAKKKVYKNGLRIITTPMKDNPTVTVLVLVGTGSDYENKNINGISHFLEHMCFKGTVKRPSPKIISEELDSMGCQYNAFTGHEYTGYYAKGDAKKFKQIFDIIMDIYLNSTLPEAEIEKEKGVIIEELNMYEDMPQAKVGELFEKVLYGDQPAGRSIVGTKDNINRMKRSDFVKYRSAHYVSSNTVIVVTGRVTSNEVYTEAKKYFSNIDSSKADKKVKTKDTQTKPNIIIKNKKTDQTHFVLGVRTFSLSDKRNPTLLVLSAILGIGMSSRLFTKLREEMGVAYYVRANNDTSIDHGSFQISTGVNNERVLEVIKEIINECNLLKEEMVGLRELNKVKSFLVGNIKLSLEATNDIASFYGMSELMHNKIKSLEEKIKQIKAVTPKDLNKMAKTIFKNKNLNLAIVGQIKNTKAINKILTF